MGARTSSGRMQPVHSAVIMKVKVKVKSLSCVRLFARPWTAAYQASPSMGFSRQEYWSGLPFPSLGDLPNPGIKPRSFSLEADALTSEPPGKPPREASSLGRPLIRLSFSNSIRLDRIFSNLVSSLFTAKYTVYNPAYV